MSLKYSLTNEKLTKRFDNPFSLVNYAIELAKVKVQRGEGIDSNPANDVLEMITKGEDLIEEETEQLDTEKEAV